jgi:hypothetical protein
MLCSSSAGGVSNASDGDSIRVFVRVRPLTSETTDADRGLCLEVQNTQIVMHAKPDNKVFTFDDVADQQSTQVLAVHFGFGPVKCRSVIIFVQSDDFKYWIYIAILKIGCHVSL